MQLLTLFDTTLPLTNPVVKFLLILLIILFAPIFLNQIKIPHLLGLIIAGAVIGPHGFNLIERDSGIILSGTAGLLYIMFLAGLEIDLVDFRKNRHKSMVFGLYTFLLPMILGTVTGIYVLNFPLLTSVLLASMFASHTLIAYPLVSKLGVAKNKAVNITVGGTMITDTLALLVLAVVVGMTDGEITARFWIRLSLSILAFGLTVLLLFPIIGRWFLRRFEDSVSQYIFVLVMVFLGAVLAELAGIEAIIGAFLAGLALNRLIPTTSPLMNRIEFVGNAIFIPFFLIGVGMLIDYQSFFTDIETLWVGSVMIIVATSSKFIAAWLTQKTYQFSLDERRLIFGLSNAQAAATLAAVLVGYNIIMGETPDGEPVRLLDETVLNGTILMILFTCTMASFVAQKGAKNIALAEAGDSDARKEEHQERILIPVRNMETTDELINLGITVKSKNNKTGLFALSIVDNKSVNDAGDTKAQKILHQAAVAASATDNQLQQLLRYDLNIANGIISVIREQRISDLILGLHVKTNLSDTFLGNLTEDILSKSNTTTLIYKPSQPFSTIQRHVVIIPADAEKEIGFPFWLIKVWNIARNSGAKLVFHCTQNTLQLIQDIHRKHPVYAEFNALDSWDDFLILSRDIQKNDNLIIVMSRREHPSFHHSMTKIPYYLNRYFADRSFILIYPIQTGVADAAAIDFRNPSMLEPFEKLDEIGKTIASLFRRNKS